MRAQISLILVFAGLFLAGCAVLSDKPVTVILQHPETMEFVTCNVDHWNMPGSYAENDKCIEDYKSKGFIIWGTR